MQRTNKQTNKQTNRQTDREFNYRGYSYPLWIVGGSGPIVDTVMFTGPGCEGIVSIYIPIPNNEVCRPKLLISLFIILEVTGTEISILYYMKPQVLIYK